MRQGRNKTGIAGLGRIAALVVLVVLIFLAVSAPPRAALSGFALEEDNWDVSESSLCRWGAREVSLTANEETGINIMTSRSTLSGDFDAQVSFALERWNQGCSSMEFAVYTAGEKKSNEMRIGRDWKSPMDVFSSSAIKGSNMRNRSEAINVEPEGRVRIIRRGGQVEASFQADGGWDTLQTFDMYENEELRLSFTLFHEDPESRGLSTTVRLYDMHVEKIPPRRKPGQGGPGAEAESDWVIYFTGPGWLRVGSRQDFEAPQQTKDEIFGGNSEEPLQKTMLRDGYGTREEALKYLCDHLTKVHIQYQPAVPPYEVIRAIFDGKEYYLRLDRGMDPDAVLAKAQEYDLAAERWILKEHAITPRFAIGKRWLIHATGHGTIDGPAKDDRWMLFSAEPWPDPRKPGAGGFEMADGMGGTFSYGCDQWEGPYCDNFGLASAMKRLSVSEVQYWPPGNRYTPVIRTSEIPENPRDFGKEVLGVQPIVTDQALQEWVVYITAGKFLHIGTVKEFETPVRARETLWGGESDELMKKERVKFGAKELFFAYEQALREVLKYLSNVTYGFHPSAQPRETINADFGGKSVILQIARDPEALVVAYGRYNSGAEARLLLDRGIVALKKFKKQWLVHATGHGTYSGPVKDDFWMMVASEPKNGGVTIPDGMGGTFGYSVDQVEGPFEDNVSLAQALKRHNLKSIGLSGEDRGVLADEDVKPRPARIEPPPRIISITPDRGEKGQTFYVTVIAEGMKPWYKFSFGEGIDVSKETYLGKNPDGEGERWLATVTVSSGARIEAGRLKGLLAARSGALAGLIAAGGSAILNEKGAVVGTGPGLAVTAPKPPGQATDPKERYFAAMQWLSQFLQTLNTLEKDMITLKVALRENCIAYREALAALADFEATRDRAYGDKLRDQCERGAQEKRAESAALYAEQTGLIQKALDRWDDLAKNLADKIEEMKEFPQFQAGLKDLQRVVTQRKTLGAMELYLAAGRSAEFRGLAAEAQNDPALEAPVRLMRVADYMDCKESRLALYCAREGQKKFSDNSGFELTTRTLEVSYLKMISSKAFGDAAGIHRAWNSYSGEVSESYIKQFFFGGLTKTLHIWTGKSNALEELVASGHDRGVMEHNGLELIMRLREKGMTFDQIKQLSSAQIKEKLKTVLGWKFDASDEVAKGMGLAVQAAFRNEDMQRLLNPTSDKFSFELGKSYYGAEEFDKSMMEYATDAMNVKNAIIFLGPNAIVGFGKATPGLLARLAQRTGMGEKWAGNLFGKNFEGAVSVRDWIFSRPSVEAVTGFIGKTKGGQALKNGMETLRALRYDSPSLATRVGMGVADLAAQLVLFEAGGKIGHAIGGEFGAFIGEAIGVLAGGALETLQARELRALKSTAEQMAKTRAKWEAANTILNDVKATVREAGETATTQAMTGQAAARMEQAANTAERVAADLRYTAEAGDNALIQAAADEGDALAAAARAARNAQTKQVQISFETADRIAAKAGTMAQRSKKTEQSLRMVSESEAVTEGSMTAESGTLKVREAPPGEVRVVQDSYATSEEMRKTLKIPGPNEGVPLPKPPAKVTMSDAEKLGEEMMAKKDFVGAKISYRTAVRMAAKDLTNPALSDAERAALKEKILELAEKAKGARQAERFEDLLAAKRQTAAESGVNPAAQADEGMKPFSAAQRQELQVIEYEKTVPLPGAGGARQVLDKNGKVIALWKPKGIGDFPREMSENGQVIAEVLASRIARKLGLRVPYAEPWSVVRNEAGVLVEEQGVLIKWIEGTEQLEKMTPGARAALKDQLAKFRALDVLMGNFDCHMGNYLVDPAGNAWKIDYGLAHVRTPSEPAADYIRCNAPGMSAVGDEVMDWTRLNRDWYNYATGNQKAVKYIDDLIKGSDMADVAKKIRELPRGELEKIIDTVVLSKAQAGEIKMTLRARVENLDKLLNERWPGALPGPQSMIERMILWISLRLSPADFHAPAPAASIFRRPRRASTVGFCPCRALCSLPLAA